MTKKTQRRIEALQSGVAALEMMHGSVIGEPTFLHESEPADCKCGYGVAIRELTQWGRKLIAKDRKEATR